VATIPLSNTSRDPDDLLASGLGVINMAFQHGCQFLLPLFSGGHDSYCACHVAARHPKFDGCIVHLDTGIGSKRTRQFVEGVCKEEGWKLLVYRSPYTYEQLVREIGFPWPQMHYQCYQKLKRDALVVAVRHVRGLSRRLPKVSLVNGARRQESERRMGNTDPFRWGDRRGRARRNWGWTSPCYDWSAVDQKAYMDSWGLARNPIKTSPLGKSGECFCGAFARPGELEMIRQFCPDVGEEIDRLAAIARAAGKGAAWGYGARQRLNVVEDVDAVGPLCSGCDYKARAAGIVVREKGRGNG
jgi:3'-phosphoadenosine 5'-phosphosulfate sulfotransferase (PAPS reductase)/FAD synthetase